MRKSTGPSKPLAWPQNISEGVAIQQEATRKCPHCTESVTAETTTCLHCGQELPPEPTKDLWEGYDL